MNWTLDDYNLALIAYRDVGAVAQRAKFLYLRHKQTNEIKVVLFAIRDASRAMKVITNPEDVKPLVWSYLKITKIKLDKNSSLYKDIEFVNVVKSLLKL